MATAARLYSQNYLAKVPNMPKSAISPGTRRMAVIIKAMGHPSRLAMLLALAKGELCVCALKEIVGADMSTVSKHLSLMRSAGLVEDRKQGLKVFYRLTRPCIVEFLNCIDTMVEAKGPRDITRRRPAATPSERSL